MAPSEYQQASRLRRSAARCLGVLSVLATLGACDPGPSSRGAGGPADAARSGFRPDDRLVEQFKSEAITWIRAERERTRPGASPLAESDRIEFAAYFPVELLARTRVLVVRAFENPPFFEIFAVAGEPYPVDLRQARALALVDTILIRNADAESSRRKRLLFHELVHVMQYEALGLERYMGGYVESWAGNGRSYRDVAHERQAFELAARFASGGAAFSVEDEVRALLLVAPGASQ